jgi:hypothetical protein
VGDVLGAVDSRGRAVAKSLISFTQEWLVTVQGRLLGFRIQEICV